MPLSITECEQLSCTWSCKCSYTLSAFVFSMERFTTSPLMHLTKWWMRKWKKNQSPRKKEKRRKMKKRRRRRSVIKLIFFSNLLLTISFTMFGCLWWLYFTRFKELLCTNIFNLNWWLGWIWYFTDEDGFTQYWIRLDIPIDMCTWLFILCVIFVRRRRVKWNMWPRKTLRRVTCQI